MATFVYSGVTYTAPAVGTTEFALTSDSGNAIPYLSQDHIYVFTSSDGGDTWTTLTAVTQYTFNSQGTEIILATGTVAGQQIRLQRKTPLSAQYVVFSDGSLLTSNQLNQAELFSLYCDQELYDTGGGGGGGGGSISPLMICQRATPIFITQTIASSRMSVVLAMSKTLASPSW